MAHSSPLSFSVRRREPELVAPAAATPYEVKPLSDIDDQEGLRFQIPSIQFYRNRGGMHSPGRNPAAVIREALARALVFYYPLAGRAREGDGRKLSVECNGEGVMFLEAEADVTLRELAGGEEEEAALLQPPFPYLEQVLFDVPGSGGLLNCPLLLFQVHINSHTQEIFKDRKLIPYGIII